MGQPRDESPKAAGILQSESTSPQEKGVHNWNVLLGSEN